MDYEHECHWYRAPNADAFVCCHCLCICRGKPDRGEVKEDPYFRLARMTPYPDHPEVKVGPA